LHLAEQILRTRCSKLPGRERAARPRLPRAAVIGFLTWPSGRLTFEHFERNPEHIVSAADAARVTRSVSQALAVWWSANQSKLPDALDTYYGRHRCEPCRRTTGT
jgi:hypothetical protein